MSATIYINNNGDSDLTLEQFELLHRFSDQARVWAYLLLKEAGLFIDAGEETEEEKIKRLHEKWVTLRNEWLKDKEELKKLDDAYANAVLQALQNQFKAKPAKAITDTTLPEAKNFFPKEADPETINKAVALAEKIKKDFAKLYPSRIEVGLHQGPFLSEEERIEYLTPPDITGLSEEDADKKIKDWEAKTGLDITKWTQTGKSPVLDMVKGFAVDQGWRIVDPNTGSVVYDPTKKDESGRPAINEDLMEEFASDVLVRALRSYNPFRAEDVAAARAAFGTYLFRAMVNEIKSRQAQYARNLGRKEDLPTDATVPDILQAMMRKLDLSEEELAAKVKEAGLTEESPIEAWRDFYTSEVGGKRFQVQKVPLSLSQPLGGEGEESLTLEEIIAEKGRQENLVDWKELLEPLREKLYEKVEATSGRFSMESAERLVHIFSKIFIEGKRLTEVARDFSFETDRPRDRELAVMKQFGIDTSSIPPKLSPTTPLSQDRDDRKRLWVKFFDNLVKQITKLHSQPQTPEVASELKALLERQKKAQDALFRLARPNTGRIHNLLWGDPRPGGSKTAIIPILMDISPEVKQLVEETSKLRKRHALEEFLTSISKLRTEGGLNYNLLRNKIEQRLSKENPQLFTVYSHLYESDYSNPDTAKVMKLSPARITGLKKKIITTLLDLPEIQDFLHEGENGSISPLRRFIYNEGDAVKVKSINEIGTVLNIYSNGWFNIKLDNGNEVLTIKEDIQKHSTLIDSAHNVLSHYFNRSVMTPQCYLSFVSDPAQLIILELRPSSEIKTTARLHINNNLVEITEFTEKYPDNLFSVLKGHIGSASSLDTPFTSLFEEVE